MGEEANELDDGPNITSERRFQSPVRAPATKRKKNIQASGLPAVERAYAEDEESELRRKIRETTLFVDLPFHLDGHHIDHVHLPLPVNR